MILRLYLRVGRNGKSRIGARGRVPDLELSLRFGLWRGRLLIWVHPLSPGATISYSSLQTPSEDEKARLLGRSIDAQSEVVGKVGRVRCLLGL